MPAEGNSGPMTTNRGIVIIANRRPGANLSTLQFREYALEMLDNTGLPFQQPRIIGSEFGLRQRLIADILNRTHGQCG